MQKTNITLRSFVNTGTTDIPSTLITVNDYLVYPSSIGQDLVDENGVRSFLDDPKNENLSTDFLNFLETNSTKEQLDDILYNNKKLSSSLNDYYNSTILNDLNPGKDLILKQTYGSKEVSYKENNFDLNNKRINKTETKLIDVNTEDSLYIQVVLKINSIPISPVLNNEFTKGVWKNGIFYVQGFVNLNKEDNAFKGIAYFDRTKTDEKKDEFAGKSIFDGTNAE